MKHAFTKRAALSIVIAAAVGAVAWWLVAQKKTPSTIGDLHAHYQVPDTGAITRIVLTDKGGTRVALVRRNGRWWVNDRYPAAPEKVNFLLDALKRWEVKSPVPKAARDNVIRMMTMASTTVEIYQGDHLHRKLQVGGATPDDLGTYVSAQSLDYEPYILHIPGFNGYLSVRFFTDSNEWRSMRLFFFAPESLRSLAFEFPTEPHKSFRIVIHDGRPALFDRVGNPVDTVPDEALKALILETVRLHFYNRASAPVDSLRNAQPYLIIAAATEADSAWARFYWKAPDRRSKGLTEEGYDSDLWWALSSEWPNASLVFQHSSRPWVRWGLPGLKWMRTEERP